MPLARNSAYLFGARAVNSLAIWLLVLLISRRFGPEVFGQFSFLSTIIMTGIVIANFGLDTIMVRSVSREKGKGEESLVEVLSFKFVSSCIVIAFVCSVFYLTLTDRTMVWLLAFYSLTIVANALGQSFWFYGNAFQKFQYHSFLWAFSNVIKIPAVYLSVIFRNDLAGVIAGLVVAELISFVVACLWVRQAFSLKLTGFSKRYIIVLFKKGHLMAVIFILSAVYFRFDIIMLEFMQGKGAVGIYSAAYKFIEFVSIIPGTICVAALPGLAADYAGDLKSFRINCCRTLRMLMVGGLLAGVALFYLADFIIPLLYGPDFFDSIQCLKILSGVVFFLFVNSYCTYILIATNSERSVAWTLLLAIMLNIVLNYFLIPRYSQVGAAAATLVSEVCLMLFLIFILGRKKELQVIF